MIPCSCGYQAQDNQDLAQHLLVAGAYEQGRSGLVLLPQKRHAWNSTPTPTAAAPTHGQRRWPWLLATLATAAVGVWGLPRLGGLVNKLLWALGAGYLAWQIAHYVVGPLWVFVWLFALLIVWLIGPLRWVVLAIWLVYNL